MQQPLLQDMLFAAAAHAMNGLDWELQFKQRPANKQMEAKEKKVTHRELQIFAPSEFSVLKRLAAGV